MTSCYIATDCKICGARKWIDHHCPVCHAVDCGTFHIDIHTGRYLARARGVRILIMSHASILPSFVQRQARLNHVSHGED